MRTKLIIYIIVFSLSAGLFACLFPYPIFSNYTNITEKNAIEINNLRENEIALEFDDEVKVLCIDWETANAILKNFTPFRIIDIKSGICIFVERVGGKNHADIETIDQNNTMLLAEIYDGVPSWERRPVFVEYDENVFFCASLAGFPHGENKGENDLGGHLCLHFKDSKTHGTQSVDDAHQRCIKYAYKHRNEIYSLI